MNKIIVGAFSSALLLSGAAYAAAPSLMGAPASQDRSGVYMGIQLGYANLNYDKSWVKKEMKLPDGTEPNEIGGITDSGFAGRAYLGYGFNQYFGAEVGYVYLPQVKIKDVKYSSVDTFDDTKFNQSIVDLFVKGTYPFDNGFSVYGKAGAGYVHRGNMTTKYSGASTKLKGSDNKTLPALGVGASYNFTKQFYADVAYTRYFKSGDLQAIDLIVAGVGYQFC
ncbi:MAG: outer membrane beta-barrel protein [Pseudomonadota bacterium]|nr:outer membrane beta-barrel protein [Gammaproteobacteria bacterium]MBU1927275.1 outer membrane beta-barrel protein [Gammaproteobacteria bacterium]